MYQSLLKRNLEKEQKEQNREQNLPDEHLKDTLLAKANNNDI